MDRKLTLKLNNTSIERAKHYARKRKTSLSRMVEGFFDELNDKETHSIPLTPLVKELSGIVHLDDTTDFKNERAEYLIRKHSP
jgi:hypothetical protein